MCPEEGLNPQLLVCGIMLQQIEPPSQGDTQTFLLLWAVYRYKEDCVLNPPSMPTAFVRIQQQKAQPGVRIRRRNSPGTWVLCLLTVQALFGVLSGMVPSSRNHGLGPEDYFLHLTQTQFRQTFMDREKQIREMVQELAY